jgi:hypothetical protein
MVLLKPGKLYVNNFLKYNTDPAFRKLGFNVYFDENNSKSFGIRSDEIIMIIEMVRQEIDGKIKFTKYKILTKDKVGFINIYEGLEKDWQEVSLG